MVAIAIGEIMPITNEVLGLIALLACLLWSYFIVWTIVRINHRKRKNDPLDNDLHY